MVVFKKQERIKTWTAQNGVIGTAHVGRDGAVKDFRPAKAWPVRFDGRFGFVAYRPAKGVRVEPDGVEVLYRPVAVEYRSNDSTIITARKDIMEWTPAAVFAAATDEIVIEYSASNWEIAGFPFPEWKAREVAIARAEYEANVVNYRQREIELKPSFIAWAAAQTGQNRRWLRRFALYGKAESQAMNLIRTEFGANHPDRSRIRLWLTTEEAKND